MQAGHGQYMEGLGTWRTGGALPGSDRRRRARERGVAHLRLAVRKQRGDVAQRLLRFLSARLSDDFPHLVHERRTALKRIALALLYLAVVKRI